MGNKNDEELLKKIKANLEKQADIEGLSAQELVRREKRAKEAGRAYAGKKKSEPEIEVVVEEYQDPEYAGLEEEKPPKRKKKHRRHILLKLIILMLILVFGTHYLIERLVSGTNYKPYETAYVRPSDVISSRLVENILIVGTDARNPDADSRSDCMIILSINRKLGRVVMTSILRDSYVEIPGHGQNRINAAFQFGGPDLLIQTIENNFKIGIDHYVKVDFFSFIKIIDSLGGVEIDVDDGEANYVNMYLCEINALLGVEQGNGNLTTTGLLKLTGKQALSYSRIRYIGTDFARTGRQREVMNAMIKKAKTIGPLKLLKLFNDVLPELTTDISDSDMAWLIMQAPFFLRYSVEECRIPADKTWQNYIAGPGMEVLTMDFKANQDIIRKAVYEK